jgi:hypothetical protein
MQRIQDTIMEAYHSNLESINSKFKVDGVVVNRGLKDVYSVLLLIY